MEEERRLAYVGLTRARHRLYLTHAAQRATWGRGGFSRPVALPAGDPLRADARARAWSRAMMRDDDDQRPDEERVGYGYDLRRHPVAARGGAAGRSARVVNRRGGRVRSRERGGRASAAGRRLHAAGRARRARASRSAPARDLAARREAYYGSRRARRTHDDRPARRCRNVRRWPPPRPVVPGERRYRDGDRVRHARFGEGSVVTSKLTRDDEEVTVAFPEQGVKKLLASLANLELLG